MTRDVFGASGAPLIQGDGNYSVGLSAGESCGGYQMTSTATIHDSGYYAGYLGNGLSFQLVNSNIPATGPVLSGIQTGVALQTQIELDLSDQAQPASVTAGITVTMIQDHTGSAVNTAAPVTFTYNPTGVAIFINPQSSWSGNSIYDIHLSSAVLNLDGSPLQDANDLLFLTVLDPSQSNVIWQPVNAGAQSFAGTMSRIPVTGGSPVSLHIAPGSLPGYALVLVNSNPLTSPLRVSPQVILDANQRATQSMGAYGQPLSIEEIDAYSLSNQLMNTLSQSAQVTLPFQSQSGLLLNGTAPIRADTLSLWVLDETNHLWVKMPDSQVNTTNGNVTANISQFAVFALMGSAAMDAQSAFVFPDPWRPHGPHAGTGPGQTGTESAGMTFSSLPSQCRIKIYTLTGELVRELQHSDLGGQIGQEVWDGLTTHGEHAASGVYLWRVESASDSKNGKLMVIR